MTNLKQIRADVSARIFGCAFRIRGAYYLLQESFRFAALWYIESGSDGSSPGRDSRVWRLIAYAFSKFIMGSLSDRSDARKFLVVGLILSSLLMICTGLIPYSHTNPGINVSIIFGLMLLVGWLSGMGWPPCGHHGPLVLPERTQFQNVGMEYRRTRSTAARWGLLVTAGIAIFAMLGWGDTWRAAFIFPSCVALLLAVFCWWALRDTPQACGLPPIDEYRNDYSAVKAAKGEEQKIPFKKLFVDYTFKNKILWLIALANAFVYLVRYGISDWAPVYLQEMNIMDASQSNLAFSLHNYAGVPGTIICGWISAKFFKGRCAPANVIYMVLVLIGILVYWKAAPIAQSLAEIFGGDPAAIGRTVVYTALCEIGFCIYGPVALIGIQALNLVPKNAAGTAAGFVGLFGYLFGDAVLAKIVMGSVANDNSLGWNATFWMFIVASLLATAFCATTWKREKQALSR